MQTNKQEKKLANLRDIKPPLLYLHVSGFTLHKTPSMNIFLASCRHLAPSGPAGGFVRRLLCTGNVDRCPLVAHGNRGPLATAQGKRPVLVGHASRY